MKSKFTKLVLTFSMLLICFPMNVSANSSISDAKRLSDNVFEKNSVILDNEGHEITEEFVEELEDDYLLGNYEIIKDNIVENELVIITPMVPLKDFNEKNGISLNAVVPNDGAQGGGLKLYSGYTMETFNNHVATRLEVYAEGTPDSTGNKFLYYCSHLKTSMKVKGNAVEWGIDLSYPHSVTLVTATTPDTVRYEEAPYIKFSDGTYYYVTTEAKITVVLAANNKSSTVEIIEL